MLLGPHIHCPKSLVVWWVRRFAMVGVGVTWATCSSSKSLYHNPQHTWGLLNEADEFTPKGVEENTWNGDNLQNLLRPIQACSEFYWIWLPKRKVDHLQRDYSDPQRDTTMPHQWQGETFLMTFVQGPSRGSQESKNLIMFKKKNYLLLWRFYQTIEHSVPLSIQWGFN